MAKERVAHRREDRRFVHAGIVSHLQQQRGAIAAVAPCGVLARALLAYHTLRLAAQIDEAGCARRLDLRQRRTAFTVRPADLH